MRGGDEDLGHWPAVGFRGLGTWFSCCVSNRKPCWKCLRVSKATLPHTQQDSEGSLFPSPVPQVAEQQDGQGSGWDLNMTGPCAWHLRLSLTETLCLSVYTRVCFPVCTQGSLCGQVHMSIRMPMSDCGDRTLHVQPCMCTCMYVSLCRGYMPVNACSRRRGWETHTSPSQASTPAPWGPDGGEQRVPKSEIWDGGFCQSSAPLLS